MGHESVNILRSSRRALAHLAVMEGMNSSFRKNLSAVDDQESRRMGRLGLLLAFPVALLLNGDIN